MSTIRRVVIGTTLLLLPATLAAQGREAECTTAASARNVPNVASCRSLAVAAVTHLTQSQYVHVEPRDLQNTNAGATSAGSGAQDEAVPSVQPTGAAAASLSAVGTDSGVRTIATVSLNPAMFFVPSTDAARLAKESRRYDFSLLVPVGDADSDDDGRPDYLGVRFRLNLQGPGAGAALAQAAQAFLAQVQNEAEIVNRLTTGLRETAALAACVEALFSAVPSTEAIRAQCGADVGLDARSYESVRLKLAAARAEADAKYFGLDMRADFGDPTLGQVADASATSFSAGLAFGRQVNSTQPNGPSVGVRGRAAVRYAELKSTGDVSYAFDGGFGFDARRPLDETSSILLTAGLEARYGGAASIEEQLQTNYTAFRASLSVPVAGMTALVISYGTPIAGKIEPIFAVNVNWKLLLPKAGLPTP